MVKLQYITETTTKKVDYPCYLVCRMKGNKQLVAMTTKAGTIVDVPSKTSGSKSKHCVLPSTTSNFWPRQKSSPVRYASPKESRIFITYTSALIDVVMQCIAYKLYIH